ncbi:hypothetical protein [Paenibacillus piri]|uniref:Uncharacterized protein n=1 Tax=Paenibacillus piri TaxID=2547395 RepID=A0A4R5KHX6_9BACL|nr:hypothetical protein [Paenibacillus piri]TDF95033.1 hypothetical protein E1757_21075 [Paenibacillus piri]
MQIKKKVDIESILDNFHAIARWDALGNKHYLVFPDRKRGGQWTLMNYGGDRFSVHGLGDNYSDEDESFFDERGGIVAFIWEHRSAINNAIRQAI